jgi:hypothetical protein
MSASVEPGKLWVASYPRSGNTFLRLILYQSFGIKSTSLYGSEDVAMATRPWLMERIGYAGEIDSLDPHQDKWVGIKTHDYPSDNQPAIYLVRDGRAAIVSYRHMLLNYTEMAPELVDLIEGKVWPGSWSKHFAAWYPETRPRTLLLRYEDLQFDIDGSCHAIAKFLGVQLKAPFTQSFEELNRFEPTLFRVSDNARNISEFGGHEALFDRLHEPLMRKLGYYEALRSG